jgi:glycosyltransferase involved in cell wall biosynthesis
MNILFYTPVNFRCRDIESLAKKYSEQGHKIFLLSQCEEGPLHKSFSNLGACVVSFSISTKSTLALFCRTVLRVISFCRGNEIDLLFSHLEPTNFISVIVQFFIKARVIIYRHHIDLARLQGFNKSITYRLTYRLAKDIISVSEEGKKFMVEQEKVDPRKIEFINLGYDFSLYSGASEANANVIRNNYRKDILLVTAGSLIRFKRPELSIEVVKKARCEGIDATLLFLGKGDCEENLKNLVKQFGMGDSVFFLGYVENILDYLLAADLLLHPSVSESSCVVIKESGLMELPVLVCKGVGDFDNYMVNGVNGIVVDRNDFVNQTLLHIQEQVLHPDTYHSLGVKLKEDIINRFSIEKTFWQYSKYNT